MQCLHAYVVIKPVDNVYIARKFIGMDQQEKPFGVLRRHQVDPPHGYEQDSNCCDGAGQH